MRKRLLSGLLAVSMMFSLFPVSAFAENTGGGISPDAVSVQNIDEQNIHAVTKTFKVANIADPANGIVTFAGALGEINADASGTGNYVIELAENITLPKTDEYDGVPVAVLSANSTTILGCGHTITIDNAYLRIAGTADLNLGQPSGGSANTLTFTGGSNSSVPHIIQADISGHTMNVYGGVAFTGCSSSQDILHVQHGTVNLYDDVCIKGSPIPSANQEYSTSIVYINTLVPNTFDAVLNLYGNSCVDGSECASCFGINVGYGELNMHDQSCIKNLSTGLATYGTATMDGSSVITDCSTGAHIRWGGSFTMNGASSITNCNLHGVFFSGDYEARVGTFTMTENSSITNCKATSVSLYDKSSQGGAVYMYQDARFDMKGGSITGCEARLDGGAIYIRKGQFNMEGGCITGNKAGRSGGAIYNSDSSGEGDINCTGGLICNNTAASEAADVYASVGDILPTAAGTTTDGHTITGWYQDDNPRYSPERHSKTITNDDLRSGIHPLIASYQDENIHTITFVENEDGDTPGCAYLKDEATGERTIITGTIPGEKVYLTYWNGNTLDGWNATPDTVIHPAANGQDAWFMMPDYNVTISCKDHHVPSAVETDIAKRSILAEKPTEFTVTVTSNDDSDEYFDGVLKFDDTADIEALEFFDEDDEEWRTLNYDADFGGYPFVEREGLYSTTYRFRVTFKQAGEHTLSAALYDYYDSDSIYCSFENVPFTVKDQITVDMSALDPKPEDPQINGYDPARDENDKLLAGKGDTLTFTKPDGADENLIYKLVDEGGNETEIPLVDGKYTIKLPGNCSITQEIKEPAPVDPGISDTDDTGSAIGAGIATGVFVSGATYLIGTNIWLNAIYDFVPTNRIQLAVALWNKADCPAPVSTELYPDIDADDTDAQAAARWCVEQGLMKDYHETDKDGNEEVTFKPYRYMFRPQAIKAWYDLETLLNEQQ